MLTKEAREQLNYSFSKILYSRWLRNIVINSIKEVPENDKLLTVCDETFMYETVNTKKHYKILCEWIEDQIIKRKLRRR